jgi:hypothetical protein
MKKFITAFREYKLKCEENKYRNNVTCLFYRDGVFEAVTLPIEFNFTVTGHVYLFAYN